MRNYLQKCVRVLKALNGRNTMQFQEAVPLQQSCFMTITRASPLLPTISLAEANEVGRIRYLRLGGGIVRCSVQGTVQQLG